MRIDSLKYMAKETLIRRAISEDDLEKPLDELQAILFLKEIGNKTAQYPDGAVEEAELRFAVSDLARDALPAADETADTDEEQEGDLESDTDVNASITEEGGEESTEDETSTEASSSI